MGKTGDLFKKMRHTKGTFHAKMGTIKDRNGMDLRAWNGKLHNLVKLVPDGHVSATLNLR